MEYRIEEIINFMKNWASEYSQEEWDNSGIQIFFKNKKTNVIILSLDLTDEVVDLAISSKAKLIITHHPMFFSNIKNISEDTYLGRNIIKLINNEISIYSAHTSLDIAEDGVNDVLSDFLSLKKVDNLYKTIKGYYMGNILLNNRYSNLNELCRKLKEISPYNKIRIYGKRPRKINKIAICGGSGSDFIIESKNKGVDVYITGDIKHHDAQLAYENNLCLIDIGHFESEKLILDRIEDKLNKFYDIRIIKFKDNPYELKLDDSL